MSRGPGRIERAVEATFTANPDRAYTVDDLCRIVWPERNARPEKRHTVSVLRAAKAVASRLGWQSDRIMVEQRVEQHPGDLKGRLDWARVLIFFRTERAMLGRASAGVADVRPYKPRDYGQAAPPPRRLKGAVAAFRKLHPKATVDEACSFLRGTYPEVLVWDAFMTLEREAWATRSAGSA